MTSPAAPGAGQGESKRVHSCDGPRPTLRCIGPTGCDRWCIHPMAGQPLKERRR